MDNCIFCQIIKGELGSAKIWENEEFVAILDINPNTKGMTLVLSKKHYGPNVFDMSDDIYQRFMLAGKQVSKILEKGLGVKRVVLVTEGMGIDHAHIKLYPLHGISENFQDVLAKEKIFFDKYEGYISTQLGLEYGISKLKLMAEEIKRKSA